MWLNKNIPVGHTVALSCHLPERREEAVAQYERSASFVYCSLVTQFIAVLTSSYILQKLSSLLAVSLKVKSHLDILF